MALALGRLASPVIWGAASACSLNACATSQEVRGEVRYEATLRCSATPRVRPTLLRVKYRVPHAEQADAFIVQVALLPSVSRRAPSSNPVVADDLNRYALGLISLYQMPRPRDVNEAVFSLPEWFCSQPDAQGKLVMRMLPPNPEGKLGSGRLQVVGWALE